ncbi:MAG: DUF1638 domain-containing protein [Oscillospiraceae bacterium]|jgi:hypothetical protein|nr:DUF1638 domain-containing protein [Oscillospiraceae bacterium]
MNIKIISCKIFYREIALLTSQSEHYYDVTFLRQGLHSNPKKLGEILRSEIDSVDGGDDIHTNYPPDGGEFDAILLGYALCSNCVEDVSSSRYPLVIPRAHDCISLFLGSREKYSDYFFANKGTFWCNTSWAENSFIPDERHREAEFEALKKRRGETAARKLLNASEQWKDNYTNAAFIRWDEYGELASQSEAERRCRDCAEYNNWNFDLLRGDSSFMRDFLNGRWDDERFLVVPPNHKVTLTYDERLIDYAE